MKALTFNRTSWHYWLATKVGDYKEYHNDFCAYVRSVIFGAIVMTMISGLAIFAVYAVGRDVYALYTCHIAGWFGIKMACTYGKFEDVVTGLIVCMAFLVCLVWILIKLVQRGERISAEIRRGERAERKPSFIKTAYKSIKEKTCFRVKFE